MIQSNETLPTVSIIVPVYNDPDGLRTCLNKLVSQTYPRSEYTVFVVDNGSTDTTPAVAKEFDVELLFEDEIQGSYAARNMGVRNSDGEIVAMVDADCTPSEDWVENGIREMINQSADLVGGDVIFELSDPPTSSEILDSISNMQIRESVEIRNVAKTANLFARREVFDSIGLFPEKKSGGDVAWTKKATEDGFILVYSPDASVWHTARPFFPLAKKQFRVGRGWADIEQKSRLSSLITTFLPPSPRRILTKLDENAFSYRYFPTVLLVGWITKLVTGTGLVAEKFNKYYAHS